MDASNNKHKELVELKDTINEMRDKLNNMLSMNSDTLNDDVLSLSQRLDDMIRRYAILDMEQNSN